MLAGRARCGYGSRMGITVTTRVLKDRLSEYLRRAEAGEHVLVLRDGKPVAALVPATGVRSDATATLASLAARGVVRLPTRSGPPEPGPSLPSGGVLASDMVIEDRR